MERTTFKISFNRSRKSMDIVKCIDKKPFVRFRVYDIPCDLNWTDEDIKNLLKFGDYVIVKNHYKSKYRKL